MWQNAVLSIIVLSADNGKLERVVCCRDSIFFKRKVSPTVDTSQAHLHLVYKHVSYRRFLHFLAMILMLNLTIVKRLDGIM